MTDLLECTLARWHPGIGDPDVIGWVTVGVYLAAALCAAAVWCGAAFPPATAWRERAFWAVVSGLFVLLAVNKQLDLQSGLTAAGRCLAQAQGWYEARRGVQLIFVVALIAAVVLAASAALWALRGTWRRTGGALIGLACVSGFVLIRAMGFYHVETLISEGQGGLWISGGLELTGPLLIAATALILLRQA
jgi:hypothetical protein